MSGMLFKNAKIRKPGAKVVDKHEPRGHIRRIINGQKDKLKKVQAVKNYTKPDIVTKKPSIIVKNFGSLLKGVVKQGSVVLGCVQDVQMNTMVLSIPGCLGIVDVTRVSDAYTELTKLFINTTESTVDLPTLNEMFELGDILACAVVEKNTDSEFKSCDWALSINPKQVNIDIQKWNVKKKMILNCAVKSVEDHGYMMDTGCPGVFGFMPFANAESFLETRTGSERKRLPIGQVLPCAMSLLDGDNEEKPTSAVMLTADPHAVSHSHINRNCFSAEKLHLIPPGNRVKSTVHQIRPDGIVLRIKDCKAFVPRLHLANQWQSPADYEVGSMVKGKVLLYDKASETLLVTLREPLVENVKISLPGIYCGTIVETAEVTCIESDLTYFKINSDFRGIARKHHLDGVEVELNSQHECRIINSNILDDTVTVTLQQEVLRERYMSADEPRCGDIVQGIAGEISTDGHYCVEICKAVRGIIRSAYLVHLPCDWKRGRELTCRVLKVDSQNGIVELVSLPRMVNSELPIISSYESAVPGLTTHGVFIAGNRSNSIVLFYNGIRGRVKLNSEIPLCKRWAVLDRGDVVTCVVRNGKPETQCLEIEIKDLKDSRGQFYNCTVVDVGNDGLTVEITENGMKECRFIPVNQLSDSCELNEPLLKTFQVGDTLKTVVSIKIDVSFTNI